MLPVYFDYRTYLRLARELLTSASGDTLAEAKFRSSISRSYYCAFLYTRHFHDDSKVTHGDLIAWLGQRDPIMAQDLRRLKLLREDCDYDHPITYSLGSKAQECVDIVEELLEKLDKLFGS